MGESKRRWLRIIPGFFLRRKCIDAGRSAHSYRFIGSRPRIDRCKVRTYQGAGLAAVSGTGLTDAQAKEELRKERRIGLAFRAVAYYDARRWGVLDPILQGGGRTGAVALSRTGVVNTNATIEYNFLDYWDVPDNEIAYNPRPTEVPRSRIQKIDLGFFDFNVNNAWS